MKEDTDNKIIHIWGKLLFVFLGLIMLLACNSSKRVFTEKNSFDSTYLHQLEKENHLLVSENDKLNSRISELEFTGVVFEKDSVPCPDNVITVKPDGSTEFRGAIKSFNKSKSREEEIIKELTRNLDSLAKEKEKVRTEVKTVTVTKTKKVSKWLFWFLVGNLTMFLIVNRNKIIGAVSGLVMGIRK